MPLCIKENFLAKTEDKFEANKTSSRFFIEIEIKKITLLLILLNMLKQKSSYNIDNLDINNSKIRY